MGTPTVTRYYMTNLTHSGVARYGSLSTESPAGATTTFGWRMGTFATASTTCQKQVATECTNNAAAGWIVGPTSSLPIPGRGDGWIVGPFEGVFGSGSWEFTHSLRSVSNGGNQLGRLLYKIYSATDPATQSTYTSLTPNWISSSITPTLATTNIQQRVSGSVILGNVRLFNQYLIFQELFQVTTSGNQTNQDADWSYGTTGTGPGSVSASIMGPAFSTATPPFMNWIQDEFPET